MLLFKVISFGARGDADGGVDRGGAEGNVRSGHKNGKWKRLDKVQRRDGSAAAAAAAAVGRWGRRARRERAAGVRVPSAACDRDSACKSFSSRSFAVGVIIPFRVEWRRPPVCFCARARAPLTYTHVDDPPTARLRRRYVKRRGRPSLSFTA